MFEMKAAVLRSTFQLYQVLFYPRCLTSASEIPTAVKSRTLSAFQRMDEMQKFWSLI